MDAKELIRKCCEIQSHGFSLGVRIVLHLGKGGGKYCLSSDLCGVTI